MFTGIIEELGHVVSLERLEEGAKIIVGANIVTDDSNDGDSICVNGVCLTAIDITTDSFVADVSQETLDRSTIGDIKIGSSVNLERAVTPVTRLGGHIVQGHVDGRGKFESVVQESDCWTVRISYPEVVARYLVYKGSVSVEGISLTIAKLTDECFEIAVIPKTWELTNLSTLKDGDMVNLEADVIAKYVERIMLHSRTDQENGGITLDQLKRLGFIND